MSTSLRQSHIVHCTDRDSSSPQDLYKKADFGWLGMTWFAWTMQWWEHSSPYPYMRGGF